MQKLWALTGCGFYLRRRVIRIHRYRLLPVQEFFAHIRDARELYGAFVKSGKVHDFRELGQGLFARSIEERLGAAGVQLEPAVRSARAHALAGSFFSLLEWWIAKGMKTEPQEIDELFHRMAWHGLNTALTTQAEVARKISSTRVKKPVQ